MEKINKLKYKHNNVVCVNSCDELKLVDDNHNALYCNVEAGDINSEYFHVFYKGREVRNAVKIVFVGDRVLLK